jgi:hypothetical protein
VDDLSRVFKASAPPATILYNDMVREYIIVISARARECSISITVSQQIILIVFE